MKILSLFKPLSFIPALVLMYMIYSFSAQDAELSSSTSYKVSETIVRTADKITGRHWDSWQIGSYTNQIHGIVRKSAHMIEYFLLAVAVSFPLYVYGVRGLLLMLLAGLICVGYACGDEYHQSLVSGRVASARDVGVDSIGIFVGVILVRLLGWSGRMAITGPAYERRQRRQQRELDAREAELARREAALRREVALRRTDSLRSGDASRRKREDALRSREALRRDDALLRTEAMSRGTLRRDDALFREDALQRRYHVQGQSTVSDDTRIFGPMEDVDDRTRVYRTEAEQRRYEEEYRARRAAQNAHLSEDSTSDQLADGIPLSGLFRRKKGR